MRVSGLIIFRISKNEMKHLKSRGVMFGENGIIPNNSHHHKTWYVTESKTNLLLLKQFRESTKIINERRLSPSQKEKKK